MIIHRWSDGSEGYEYEVGDRVVVERTIHGGWFNYGPTRSEHCTVCRVSHFKTRSWMLADLGIRYSPNWGPASCYPWMIKPHPDAFVNARIIEEPA
ncbi:MULTISPECIES: hypothetical protein [unclassified Mesorhizobium]|uniref:hypothetical protein n=1 Tax=unclassified Mesorhizobium TaxID=325217 RepID=UPI0011268422|nr:MULTISPECIES: hypothetical protein [unclassified Mesorhizobium]TPL42582.1 hypothetical protein FJ961_07790 [Mesorhizobium sp. B2-4-5]TPL66582.1 hypothetical protein FJ949_09450 [Mesorhizobium sp. B2-4-1]